MRYCLGVDETGGTYALRDPREAEIMAALADLPREATAISAALHHVPRLIPAALRDDEGWRDCVGSRLGLMLNRGMAEAVRCEASTHIG